MGEAFRDEMFFLGVDFETLRQTGARLRRTLKIIAFSSKSIQQVLKPFPKVIQILC